MSYIHLFYITSKYNIEISFLLLDYQMTNTGNEFKKPNVIFFCFTEYRYATYLLYQHRQKCLWCYSLLKVRMLK